VYTSLGRPNPSTKTTPSTPTQQSWELDNSLWFHIFKIRFSLVTPKNWHHIALKKEKLQLSLKRKYVGYHFISNSIMHDHKHTARKMVLPMLRRIRVWGWCKQIAPSFSRNFRFLYQTKSFKIVRKHYSWQIMKAINWMHESLLENFLFQYIRTWIRLSMYNLKCCLAVVNIHYSEWGSFTQALVILDLVIL
jgi:hypothetical protein